MVENDIVFRPRRPFAGAWIETSFGLGVDGRLLGRPFAGAWIETADSVAGSIWIAGRPFAGAWIETIRNCWSLASRSRSPLRGGVD